MEYFELPILKLPKWKRRGSGQAPLSSCTPGSDDIFGLPLEQRRVKTGPGIALEGTDQERKFSSVADASVNDFIFREFRPCPAVITVFEDFSGASRLPLVRQSCSSFGT